MTVTAFKKCKTVFPKTIRSNKERQFVFIFENSHTLLQGVLFLYRNKRIANIKSALYSFKNFYCLIIYSKTEKPYFLHLKEYCKPFINSPLFAEYIKEYGKLLIDKKAIKTLGNVFFKEI